MASEWAGKVAVITGGGSGIGLALAKAFACEGMDLVLASRDEAKLEAAAATVRKSGRCVLTVPCDVTDRTQVHALADRTTKAFGQVDLLCANAGAMTAGRYVDHTGDDWDWAIDVNLRGLTNCVQAFYPVMVKRRAGTIMLTGSQTSMPADWVLNAGPYPAIKAAVLALALSLRVEAAEYGVAVSLLLPASTHTEIFGAIRPVVPGAEKSMGASDRMPPPLPNFSIFLTSEEVAERALAGLRKNAPIIATHAAVKPLVEDYFNRILSAYDEAAAFQLSADREGAEAHGDR